MADNVEEKVIKIIAEQLEVPEDKVVPGAVFVDDLKADSLAIVELVLALEEAFPNVETAYQESVPENPAEGHPLLALNLIAWGVQALSGTGLVMVALIGLVVLLLRAVRRATSAALVPLALVGTAAVPWAAFVDGHPYRIRYMVPLLAAQAVLAGVAAGCWKRAPSGHACCWAAPCSARC